MVYKTAYRLAAPLIVALTLAFLFATGIELLVGPCRGNARADGISRDALIGRSRAPLRHRRVCPAYWASLRASIKRFEQLIYNAARSDHFVASDKPIFSSSSSSCPRRSYWDSCAKGMPAADSHRGKRASNQRHYGQKSMEEL
jgi:hypothetical protein